MESPKPWWMTDTYDRDCGMPSAFLDSAGPNGVALVRAWTDGRTDQGWGLNPPKNSSEGFMPRYLRDDFNARSVLYGHNKGKWAFAFVMRSVKLVCVDIDGKNGGLEHAKKLGALPPTLAETSKSGNGYHLFYLHDETWDVDEGFGLIHDRIGIEQGVDIRSTGCVYHYDTQRWNGDRKPAPLPDYLRTLLLAKQQQRAQRAATVVAVLDSQDETEILLMHDALLTDLAKPIAAGKRNNTLFAIGQQMKTAQVPDWEAKIEDRAAQVGLSADEIDKLVANITRYQ
jgi:hypothetical protein